MLDAQGNVYGTTMGFSKAVKKNSHAPIPQDSGGRLYEWNGSELVTLYQFCAQDACADGNNPGQIAIDASGDIFGLTGNGGTHKGGVIYEYSP